MGSHFTRTMRSCSFFSYIFIQYMLVHGYLNIVSLFHPFTCMIHSIYLFSYHHILTSRVFYYPLVAFVICFLIRLTTYIITTVFSIYSMCLCCVIHFATMIHVTMSKREKRVGWTLLKFSHIFLIALLEIFAVIYILRDTEFSQRYIFTDAYFY